MNTNFPTTELHFVFAFTYCRLRIYEKQEPFIRKVLEAHYVEFLQPDASEDWQDIDTRVLLDMVNDVLPRLLEYAGLSGPSLRRVKRVLQIRSLSD